MSDECFYCDEPLVDYEFVPGWEQPNNMRTRDHVIPRKVAAPLSTAMKAKNTVEACALCNRTKGHREPLYWLGSPRLSDAGAERLADKLIELGYANEQVQRALNRRKHAVANRNHHVRA